MDTVVWGSRHTAAAMGILLLMTMGCAMGQQPQATRVAWDLTRTHARSAVGWPAGRSVYDVGTVDATIQLPGGRTFRGSGVRIRVWPDGDQIQILQVLYPQATIDDGYRRAKALAAEWHLRTDQVDSWYQEVQNGRRQGVKDVNERFSVLMAGQPLAPGGPIPSAGMLDSFDLEQPLLVDLEFQWVQVPG
jgi:hypothetical protein